MKQVTKTADAPWAMVDTSRAISVHPICGFLTWLAAFRKRRHAVNREIVLWLTL